MEADRRVLLAVADARFRVGMVYLLCALIIPVLVLFAPPNGYVTHECGVKDPPMCGNAPALPSDPLKRAGFVRGEKLFKSNCASCHKSDKKMTGPALRGAKDRWAQSGGDLYAWIKNSQGYLAAKSDPYAKALFKEYNGSIMTPNTVSNEDIDAILSYVDKYLPYTVAVP